jgi:hypothetical protein
LWSAATCRALAFSRCSAALAANCDVVGNATSRGVSRE